MNKKTWRPFLEAKKFARSLNMNTKKEWYEYCKSGKRPKDIPTAPQQVYKDKGWKGYGDWLGTDNTSKGEWRSFEKAREFAKSLNLTSVRDWNVYSKSGKRPDDIPSTPVRVYKDKGWTNWGDFLGTGNIATQNIIYRPFKEARKYARSLNLKGLKEWDVYSKSGKKSNDIPSCPNKVYKDKGWKGMGDWLGTGNIHKGEWRSFEKAREFARSLNLKGQKEWYEYSKSGKKPDDIPHGVYNIYKNKGWTSWPDWLGHGNLSNHEKHKLFLPFKEARKFARSLKLTSQIEWYEYCKYGKRPNDIPSHTGEVYKGKGWINWGDFLGTGNVGGYRGEWRSFEKAREFARSLNLTSVREWAEYSKSGKKHDDIPTNPNIAYKYKGWINWGDFLGTGNIANFNKNFMPFKEAREFARSLNLKGQKEWYEYSKSGKKSNDIPSCPNKVYINKGWISWGDWLGTGNIHAKWMKKSHSLSHLYTRYNTTDNNRKIFIFALSNILDLNKMRGKTRKDYRELTADQNRDANINVRFKESTNALSVYKDIIRDCLIEFPDLMNANWKDIYSRNRREIIGWGCK